MSLGIYFYNCEIINKVKLYFVINWMFNNFIVKDDEEFIENNCII